MLEKEVARREREAEEEDNNAPTGKHDRTQREEPNRNGGNLSNWAGMTNWSALIGSFWTATSLPG
jgi:hypothetical protein